MIALAFIEKQNDLQEAVRLRASDSKVRFIASTEDLTRRAKDLKMDCRWLGAYISDEALDRVEAEAWRIARGWHQTPVLKARLEYRRGHNLGFLAEFYFGFELCRVLKALHQIKQLLQSESPDEIHCFGDSFYASVCKFLHKSVVVHAPRKSSNAPQAAQKERFKNLLKEIADRFYSSFTAAVLRSQKKPLLICAALRHIQPVLPELQKSFEVHYLDRSLQTGRLSYFARNGIRYFSYASLARRLGRAERARIDAFVRGFHQTWPEVSALAVEQRVFEFEGQEFSGLIASELRVFVAKKSRQIAEYIEVFDRLFALEEYASVVVDEDVSDFRKTLCVVAAERAVRCVQVPHGVNMIDFHFDLFPVSSDIVAVGGPGVKEFYEQNGVSAGRLKVTGVPRYDGFVAQDDGGTRRSKVRARLGVPADKKLVLFASTSLYPLYDLRRNAWQQFNAFEDVIEVLNGFRDAFVVVKPHQSDQHGDWMRSVLARSGPHICVAHDIDPSGLIAASDVVISFNSNFMIESIFLSKPTVILDYFPRVHSKIPYLANGHYPLTAKNKEELRRCLDRIWAGSASEQVRQAGDWIRSHWVGPADGCSGSRVAQVITEMSL